MRQSQSSFQQPTLFDRIFNKTFGFFVKLGLGLSHNFLLEVRGRKSGLVYSTPITCLTKRKYLVVRHGDTQWVRNVMVNQRATLVKGGKMQEIQLQPIAG